MFRSSTLLCLLFALTITSVGDAQIFRRSRANFDAAAQQQMQIRLQQFQQTQNYQQAYNPNYLRPNCPNQNQSVSARIQPRVNPDWARQQQQLMQQRYQAELYQRQNCQAQRQMLVAQQQARQRQLIAAQNPAARRVIKASPQPISKTIVAARPNYDTDANLKNSVSSASTPALNAPVMNRPAVTSHTLTPPVLNAPVKSVQPAVDHPAIQAADSVPNVVVDSAFKAPVTTEQTHTSSPPVRSVLENALPVAAAKDESFKIVDEASEEEFFKLDDLMLDKEQSEPVPAEKESEPELDNELGEIPPLSDG